MKVEMKLIDYPEEVIERGILIRCKGKYPYEEVVDFLLCESKSKNCLQLVVATGYKAGLTFCYLPEESIPKDRGFGCLTKWLIENWEKWGYFDCPLENVWLIENSVPNYPNDKIIRFTVITQNQNKREKAEKLVELVLDTLQVEAQSNIERYEKFENSYRIEFLFSFDKPAYSIEESIEKTSRLCSPWVVKYDSVEKEIELLFNQTEGSKYEINKLNVIKWANWTVE